MKKNTTNSQKTIEAQMLALLEKVLPKATPDARLAARILEAVQQELSLKQRAAAFDKFCQHCELPDLEAESVATVRQQLAAAFTGGDITIKPNKKEKTLTVEVALPDGTQFSGAIPVGQASADAAEEEPEFKPKYVPWPVCLPGDKELVWMLARPETVSPEEAALALTKLEDDFWGSKSGQKMIRDGVERCFPEFVARVPGGLLKEIGLKRHYKLPEPIKVIRSKAAK
jgi:hypothetical protein